MTARTHMAAAASQIVERSNEGAVFEARFWRDFYRAMLTRTARKALGKLLGVGLGIFLIGLGTARPPVGASSKRGKHGLRNPRQPSGRRTF
jgi:hypothetical protein